MSAMTDYLENKLINHVLRGQAYTPPTAIYVALFTTATTEAGGGTEVTSVGSGYTRMQVVFTDSTAGATSNTADIIFPVALSDWGTIVDVALFDAQTGGNMLFHGPATVAKPIQSGDQYVLRAGEIDLTGD
ncbi:phage tail fiber protein [Brevibacillus migulae]|uniref:phage tail fiber protein n=1 Tax=Brevibacillus migulae TaxID=1644114 RepID=UPI00106DEB57|nr:hypothetical protein [Brevibacillus migulae]